MMKHRLIVFALLVVLFSAVLAISGMALAEESPLKVAMQLSNSTFTEPKDVTVSIRVSNTSDEDLPGPVTLYYSNSKQVEDFGAPVLEAGASKTWSGTVAVTQDMLDSGRITFKIRYSTYSDSGETVNRQKSFGKEITYVGGVSSVEVNRTIKPTMAGKNQEVSITYDIINTGTLDITDVSIQENAAIASKPATIDRIAAGEKGSHTFTFKMGSKDVQSQAQITYKAGGKTETIEKESATVKYGEMNLKATLSADKKGGQIGDSVTLTLKLANSGKTEYTGITVTDPVLGEVFTDQKAPAGKTTVLEKTVTISETTDYQFSVTATSSAGEVETATDRLTITAVSPDQVLNLNVHAEADRDMVYQLPGTVKFRVSVTNESAMDVSDVVVSASGMTLYTFPSILAGETREFTRDVGISMAGQFQFIARCRNQLGERQDFSSNILYIGFTEPTPVPTEVPIVTPPRPAYERVPTEADLPDSLSQTESLLQLGGLVLGCLFGAFLLLTVISAIVRAANRKKYNAAVDHLYLSSTRDYTASGSSYMDGGSISDREQHEEESSLESVTEDDVSSPSFAAPQQNWADAPAPVFGVDDTATGDSFGGSYEGVETAPDDSVTTEEDTPAWRHRRSN